MLDRLIKRKDKVTIVSTKEELRKAVEGKAACIEIQGGLAEKMRWIGKLSSAKRRDLAGALHMSKAVRYNTMVAESVVAPIAGKEIAMIILALGLSVALIIAILKDYDVEITLGETTIRLKRKSA